MDYFKKNFFFIFCFYLYIFCDCFLIIIYIVLLMGCLCESVNFFMRESNVLSSSLSSSSPSVGVFMALVFLFANWPTTSVVVCISFHSIQVHFNPIRNNLLVFAGAQFLFSLRSNNPTKSNNC